MSQLFNFVLHLDAHLKDLTDWAGPWTYVILFAIIFCETGLVVTPFLPGDSLLFAAGATAAASDGNLNVVLLWLVLLAAAILGDTVNYHIGYFIGPKVLRSEKSRWLNKKHLDYTHQFFEKYGPVTIILARFMPVIRTFAPFVAGVGAMSYRKFILYNVVGGFIWVTMFVIGGYWFGRIPVVADNFFIVILVIVFLSMLPWIGGVARHFWLKRIAAQTLPDAK